MRDQFRDSLAALDGDELLTTGEAAALLGVSRQHVVDLIDRDELPAIRIGTHRRVRRGDLLAVRASGTRRTRDQERSLWLGAAIAGELVRDPERVRQLASARLKETEARANRWDHEWEKILARPTTEIIRVLTSDTVHARELRQNSPFAGALSPDERERVLAAFTRERRRDAPR